MLFPFLLLLALGGPNPSTSPAASPAPDASRIAKAREAMRPLGREGSLGPWRLMTEAAGGELTGLDAVAAHLPAAYTARFGLDVAQRTDEIVVIYSSDVRYRAFVEADRSPAFAARGHAGGGLAAFALGKTQVESRALLIHELVHLLSRRVFGSAAPAWLDEGLAQDLAWCRTDAEGRLEPDTFEAREGVEAWIQRARAGRMFPIAALLSPGTRLFSDPGTRRDATTSSAMLVRWCLGEPSRGTAFRAFLRSVSKGGAADAAALAAALGMDAPSLQREFLAWARAL